MITTSSRGASRRSINPRRRFVRTVVLFIRLMLSFLWSYGRARLAFGRYDFFEDHARNRARARLIRDHALRMGGVMIKVGQFLSTRVDLFPEEYIEELALLQDEVPSVNFDLIREAIESSFGRSLNELYLSFDAVPIASASLGQAHRAVLSGGQQVIVKVKRPHIDDIVEADLSSLRFVVTQLSFWRVVRRRVDLQGILSEFRSTLREELDYISEAHNAERLGCAFATSADVLVPRIYWSRVRPNVITLEYLSGIKITEYERLEEAGVSRAGLAEVLLQSYLQQVLVDGFFHADPHPGNVFARPGPVLILVDFGMVGRLAPRMRASLRQVFVGVVRRDFDAIVQGLVQLGFIRPGADLTLIRRTVMWTVDTFYEMSFAELRDVDPRDVLDRTYDLFKAEAFQIPTMFAFMGRALGTLNGLCTGLDPEFQFASVARPYARKLLAEDQSFAGAWNMIRGEGRQWLQAAVALPRLTRGVLEELGDTEWLRRDLDNVSQGLVRVERMVRALLVGLLATAFLVSASFLAPRYTVLAIIALVVTVLLILRVTLFLFTSRHAPRP